MPQSTIPIPKPPISKNQAKKQVFRSDCESYRPLFEKYDWNVDTMMRIMYLESKCNPNALNDSPRTRDYSVGLLQINLYGNLKYDRPSASILKNPATNIKIGYEIYKHQGYNAWSVYK